MFTYLFSTYNDRCLFTNCSNHGSKPKRWWIIFFFWGGGTQQIGGVQKTTDFLDKSTWTLGILLIVLILLSNVTIFGNQGASDSKALDGAMINKSKHLILLQKTHQHYCPQQRNKKRVILLKYKI